jgi:predicted amidohydrolase YtcJ
MGAGFRGRVDPGEIPDMEIEMTIVDGRVVYERGVDG